MSSTSDSSRAAGSARRSGRETMFGWLVENPWILWLVLFLGLAAVETLTLDLMFLMLSVGALAALIASFVTGSFFLQGLAFCVVALMMVLLVRPIALRHLRGATGDQRSNIDRLIGEPALALETVTSSSGTVKIGGDTWSARTLDGISVPAGARLAVARIEGATAVVEPAAESPDPDADHL
ncbi:NfeD family protein [Arthrobacter sp. MSA 4-2]|uniref:NfeD family protein n=1 Tax=Arthrobacter sp. MSA 4-2 TaxID=2794349 RepID=UPI0035A88ADF